MPAPRGTPTGATEEYTPAFCCGAEATGIGYGADFTGTPTSGAS